MTVPESQSEMEEAVQAGTSGSPELGGGTLPESEVLDGPEQYRNREDLERTLKAARTSEAWLRKIIDTIPTQAYCNRPDGTNEFSNKRWQDYTGLSSEESSGWGWQAAFHPEDLPRAMDKWRKMLAAGEPDEVQARLRRHDGVFRWFLFRTEPLCDAKGMIVRWYATATDIEDLKQTESKLRESERELRQITDAVPQALGVLDPNGGVLYANQTTLDYTGFTAEDVLAPIFRERMFHPEDLKRLRRERKAALEDGIPFESEQRVLRKDGQYRWFLIRYNPFRDEHGHVVRWYVAGTDIDELKRTEEKLREDERELQRTVDAIPHEVVVQDPSGVTLWANQATLDYTGLTADDVVRPGFRERIFHPDDIEKWREERRAALARGLPFEIEQRALGKDGRYRWFLIRYNPLLNGRRNVLRWYATGTDIDDRKRTETLHAAEKRTLEMIADGASLKEVLDQLCSSIDAQVAPSVTTVLLIDVDGKHLFQGGGPRVPREWISAIIPVPVAFEAGLCGTAAFLKERVVVPDVGTEPNWPDQYRDLAIRNGIRAAWSEPILTKDKEVLGTFAVYSHESRVPTEKDLALIEGAGRVAQIAIERQRSQEALRNALERLRLLFCDCFSMCSRHWLRTWISPACLRRWQQGCEM